MAERLAVKNGELEKHITEILLDDNQTKLFSTVKERLEKRTGFKPAKWQLMSMIFVEGLKSLDIKLSNIR